jgi:hypothetical protein
MHEQLRALYRDRPAIEWLARDGASAQRLIAEEIERWSPT